MKLKLLSALTITIAAMPAFAEVKVASFTSPILNNNGEEIGTLSIKDGGNGAITTIELAKNALTPGWHAVHFHSVADCSDHDEFKHAMSHVNYYKKKHGLLNQEGYEEGDLTNIYVYEDGSAEAEIFSAGVKLEGDEERALKDKDGSALIIHSDPDDYITQPIGNAGSRVACSVIK